MNKLIQIVKQTSTGSTYGPRENEECKDGDWNYSSQTCGENCIVYNCSKLSVNRTCEKIGTKIDGEWKVDNNGNSESPLVKCTYYPDTFTEDDIMKYVDKFGEDDKYNKIVMPTYCFQISTECVDNPETETQWSTCPNMLNRGNIGMFCRNWRSNNIDDADTAQNDYCNDNSDDPTCSCYNRDNNEVYQIVSGIDEDGNVTNSYNAGCWYKPCTQPSNYLVPSELINDNPPCPSETKICTSINKIIS